MRLAISVLLVIGLGHIEAYKTYAGYQVLRTAPLDESSLQRLADALHGRPELELLNEARVGRHVDVMVAPEHAEQLASTLARLGLQPAVRVPDLGLFVENERAEIERLKQTEKRNGRALILDRFLELSEIDAYLDEVVATYSTIASFINIGASYEGRTMRVLKLSNGPGKSGIWFDSGIHACEWAGPPTTLYAINQLTENLAANQAMLDKNDFYFMVVANPDGYTFSWAEQRFWRKTRMPNEGTTCVGADPNRNWDWHWTSVDDACSVNYPGTGPFIQPEVKNMAAFLTFNTKISAAISIHSFGNYMLYPWGDVMELPPISATLNRIGGEAAAALAAVRGTTYTVGSISNVLYTAAGGTTDWVYGGINIQLPFTIELPAGGGTGFDLPSSEILPVATETWEAIKVFASYTPDRRGQIPA